MKQAALKGMVRTLAVALALVAVASCAEDPIAHDSPLSNAYLSPEALAEAALDAIAARNDSALAALMIERDEYEGMLWPEMPDGQYTPFAFIWSQTLPPSRNARQNMTREFADVPLELVSVDLGPEDKVERYPSFTLYQDARMTVRRTDTGAEDIFPLMDALVEMGGGWKFMNYRDDA